MGVDVWPVHTVTVSNNSSYETMRGPFIAADDVRAVIAGIDERGVLPQCDAVLTGYQGTQEVGQVVLDTVELVKSRNPQAIYCCDPVMGDVGRGFYARPGIPEFFKESVVPKADVVAPNLFELEFLTDRSVGTVAEAIEAAHQLRARGPRTVLVTSVVFPETEPDVMRMVAVDGEQAWEVVTPMLGRAFTGTGDVTTAMFLAHLLGGAALNEALERTASSIYGVLKATMDAGSREPLLVPAQDQIVAPSQQFSASRVS